MQVEADGLAHASDPEVARHLTWRTHASLADTHRFLDAADGPAAPGATRQVGTGATDHLRQG